MKKLIALMLALLLALSLAACGGKGPAEDLQQPGQSDVATPDNQQDVSDDRSLTVEAVKAAPETPAENFSFKETDEGIVITNYEGDGGVVVVPQKINGVDVVEIGNKAFVNEDAVTAVCLPDTVREVGDHAFENCSGMQIFVSGAAVKSLGDYAFNSCVGLKNVELNEGLEKIGLICFSGMENTEIVVPASVTEMLNGFMANSSESPIVIVGEPGSEAEEYVINYGEACHLVFKAK